MLLLLNWDLGPKDPASLLNINFGLGSTLTQMKTLKPKKTYLTQLKLVFSPILGGLMGCLVHLHTSTHM